jgi:hypothetical protein
LSPAHAIGTGAGYNQTTATDNSNKGASMTKVLRICLFAGCMLNSAFAVQPAVVKVHEGEHWVWFAQRKQFEEHAKDIERFYDYADRAFRYLKEAWALEPPRQKYALLVWHKVGGGFATGNIAEVRPLTGKRTPGIGVSYDAFFNTAHGIK